MLLVFLTVTGSTDIRSVDVVVLLSYSILSGVVTIIMIIILAIILEFPLYAFIADLF